MTNSWLEVDWSSSWVPDESRCTTSLQRLRFTVAPVTATPVLQVVDTFRSMFSKGDACVAAFDVHDADRTAAWFLSRDRDDYGLAAVLIRSRTFAEELPQVASLGPIEDPEFSRESSLSLDGSLAQALRAGGAYTGDGALSGAEAKAQASALCISLFDHRYDDVIVDRSHAAWSPWFKGVVWDSTWVITDKRHRRVTVLCMTDTD